MSMTKWSRFLSIPVLISIIFISSMGSAADDTKVITVIGQAAIFQDDKAAARDKAIDDALRKAVESAVGTMISSETVVENFQMLSDKVYTNAKGYVEKYDVISEKANGNTYVINIKASVSTGKVKDKLSAINLLITRKGKPRIMIMVAEQNIGQPGLSYWWGNSATSSDLGIVENTLIAYFKEKGFTFIDHQTLQGKIQVSDATEVMNKGNKVIQQISNLTDAEVVIVGKAVAVDAGIKILGTSMKSGQADISVRAINCDNGEIIAIADSHAAYPHINITTAGTMALKKATNSLSEKLMGKILKQWQKDVSGAARIVLKVNGLEEYGDLARFKNFVQEIVRGVKSINERNVEIPKATIDIEIAGDSRSLAGELSAKKFGNLKVKVMKVTPNEVVVILSKK